MTVADHRQVGGGDRPGSRSTRADWGGTDGHREAPAGVWSRLSTGRAATHTARPTTT